MIQDLAAAALESWKEAEKLAAECRPDSDRMVELLDAAAQARALYADLTSWALVEFQATRFAAEARPLPSAPTIEIRPWPSPDGDESGEPPASMDSSVAMRSPDAMTDSSR